MSWSTRFRLREYLRSSFWVVPLAGGVVGVLLGLGDVFGEKSLSLPPSLT